MNSSLGSAIQRLAVAAAAIVLASAACASSNDTNDLTEAGAGRDATNQSERPGAEDDRFCEAMDHLIALLSPTEKSSPDETEATFTEAAAWFAQAEESAPDALASDVSAYAAAYDGYIQYLATVGFDLDVVFDTPEGEQLAIDTSHAMTPTIVDHVIGTCRLSFGEETQEPPAG